MDPNQTLSDIRAALEWWHSASHTSLEYDYLAERIEALDKWMSGCGYLPEGWS